MYIIPDITQILNTTVQRQLIFEIEEILVFLILLSLLWMSIL